MTDSEKRRRQLLEQTRELYHDRREVPAVHPRYGAAYHEIYHDDQAALPGTFGLRLFLSILLFATFVSFDKNNAEVWQVDSGRIVDEITYDVDLAEVWKEL